MAWQLNQKKPLLLLPDLASLTYNWSHESAWAGNNWLAEVGTPARDNAHALFGSWSGKATGSTTQTMLNRFTYSAAVWQPVDGGQYSCYAWVYPTAFTGTAAVRLQLNLTKAAGVALTTPSQTIADYPISSLTLNAWNLVRVVAPGLTAAQQAEFVSVDYRITLVPNGGSATFWVDGCHFGRACDAQDLGPYTTGAQAAAPFDYELGVPYGVSRALAGNYAMRRANAGFNAGTLELTPVNPAGMQAWETFVDLCMGGSYVTLLYSQQDLTRDFHLRAYVESDDSGVDPVVGMTTSYLRLRWRASP